VLVVVVVVVVVVVGSVVRAFAYLKEMTGEDVELVCSELLRRLGHSASVELLGLEHDVSVKVVTGRNIVVMMEKMMMKRLTMMMIMMMMMMAMLCNLQPASFVHMYAILSQEPHF